jgi:plastocyanin
MTTVGPAGTSGPGRASRARPVFFLAAFLLWAGCNQRPPESRSLTVRLDSGTIALPPGAHAHRVRIEGGTDAEELSPAELRAHPGDVVLFIAGNALTHAIAFDTAAMEPGPRAFLARTEQVSGPPLVSEGSEWVVNLQDAPPGDYPFLCLAHGGRGRLTVVPR